MSKIHTLRVLFHRILQGHCTKVKSSATLRLTIFIETGYNEEYKAITQTQNRKNFERGRLKISQLKIFQSPDQPRMPVTALAKKIRNKNLVISMDKYTKVRNFKGFWQTHKAKGYEKSGNYGNVQNRQNTEGYKNLDTKFRRTQTYLPITPQKKPQNTFFSRINSLQLSGKDKKSFSCLSAASNSCKARRFSSGVQSLSNKPTILSPPSTKKHRRGVSKKISRGKTLISVLRRVKRAANK